MVRVFVVVLMVAVFSSPVFAQEKPTVENSVKEAVKVNNKLCPVSGEKIGDMGDPETLEYNGKIYSFCCPSCLSDFKKDPEKFAKIAEAEAASAAEQK